jgi:hypothetical protein
MEKLNASSKVSLLEGVLKYYIASLPIPMTGDWRLATGNLLVVTDEGSSALCVVCHGATGRLSHCKQQHIQACMTYINYTST